FGGATALLPIYATDILDIGARGYGLLQASFEFGAFLMAITLVTRRPVVNTGRALLITVAYFGVGTMVFGLSRWFPLSLLAYMSIGMADQLSVVLRQTTIQLSTPDDLRGRVSSVSQLFIGASNQLGAVESGLIAALTSATFAVVSGGAGCIAVVGVVAVKLPGLRRYRVADSEAEARLAEIEALGDVEPAAGGDG
ncbi:MAG TPA: MFS transporter, partial [Dehalococcoidia bacterium]